MIALLTGAAVSALAAITLGLREGTERMRQASVKRARAEALSEHHRFLQRLDHELKNPLTAIRAEGIPEAEISLVWEELYRGQSVNSVPGSGIGLALALAIVERHGGQIGLQSRLGQGTTVTVRLPAA